MFNSHTEKNKRKSNSQFTKWIVLRCVVFISTGTTKINNRVSIYVLVLTDSYPSIESNQKVRLIYPEIDNGQKLNSWLPLVKWLLAIPLYIVGIFYALYALFLTFIAWISVVKNGTYPVDKAEEVVKVIAYWNRVYGYALLLVTDEYPSFSLN